MATILSICQEAADELSLDRPSSLVGGSSGSETERRLFRMLNKVCQSLAGRHDWQVLRREQTFTTVAASAQVGVIPSDFRRFVSGTMYNRTLRRPIGGPVTPSEWQDIQSTTARPTQQQMYQRGDTVYITPTPPVNESVYFEYITTYLGTQSSVGVAAFTSDAAVPYFDAELLTLGVVYRMRQTERLDYAEEMRDFELRLLDLIKRDGNKRVLDLDQPVFERQPNAIWQEIPDLGS